MGPQLFQKSVLQSLSDEEVQYLNCYYMVVYAPIQFADILQYKKKNKIANVGDLKRAHKIQRRYQLTLVRYYGVWDWIHGVTHSYFEINDSNCYLTKASGRNC